MRHISIGFLFGAGLLAAGALGCNVSHTGAECGATGCAAGQACCLTCGGYACVPEGTACGCPDEDAGPGACGGPSRISCGPGSFCNATSCGGFGECRPAPPGCGRIYDPVCGCDGRTYPNSCSAEQADVVIASAGECGGTACGTRGAPPCPSGTYCRFDAGCGADDGGGACEPVPVECSSIDAPVCGCDGVTYGNACLAAAASMSAAASGACGGCDPQDARVSNPACDESGIYWTGAGCEVLSGCCEGADCGSGYASVEACRAAHPACDQPCGARLGDTCRPDEFCYFASEGCDWADDTGICRPRPTECPDPGGVPVCGCDSVDYTSECAAQLAGTDVGNTRGCIVPG